MAGGFRTGDVVQVGWRTSAALILEDGRQPDTPAGAHPQP
jgi:hypothetical protein